MTETDKNFLAQPKINLQLSFKSTPDSLKQRLKAFERKRSLGGVSYMHNLNKVKNLYDCF